MFHMAPDRRIKETFFPGYALGKDVPFSKTTQLVQLISMVIFCGIELDQAQKVSSKYNGFLTETAQSFLYQWEMYEKAPCFLESGTKVAFMGDEKIFIGRKEATGHSFKFQECKQDGI